MRVRHPARFCAVANALRVCLRELSGHCEVLSQMTLACQVRHTAFIMPCTVAPICHSEVMLLRHPPGPKIFHEQEADNCRKAFRRR